MSPNIKQILFWVVIFLVVAMLFVVVRTTQGPKDTNLTFTEFVAKVEAGSVDKVTITGNEVHGTYKSNPNAGLHTFIPVNYPDINQTDAGARGQRGYQGHQFLRLGLHPDQRFAVHRGNRRSGFS